MMIKNILKTIVPKAIFDLYYRSLEHVAAAWFGMPSKKMIVIGVTGTKGKSTVVHLIGHFLEQAGYKIGWTSSIDFKIGDILEANATKMTMPGRFALQKKLSRMVKAGCQYAIIETSSEGLVQFRHIGIEYDVAVFTNLSPEHIERHRSFEAYKTAKETLFQSLAQNASRKTFNQQMVQQVHHPERSRRKVLKISVVNTDDASAPDFLQYPADEKIGTTSTPETSWLSWGVSAQHIRLSMYDTNFILKAPQGSVEIHTKLMGIFNVENILLASATVLSQGVPIDIVQRSLDMFEGVAGRMDRIDASQGFTVFIDYAHEPKSLESVYQFCRSMLQNRGQGKLLCVLSAAGGGRDRWKRPVMGGLAEKYCDVVVLTNEDPYDENPEAIIEEIESGFTQRVSQNFRILNRTEAIGKVLSLASNGDIVLLTGKGSESWIMGPNGSRIPWNEKKVVENVLKTLG